MWEWLVKILSFFGLLEYINRIKNWILDKLGRKKKIEPAKQPVTKIEPKVEYNIHIENSPNARVEIFTERPDKENAKKLHSDKNVWVTRKDQIEPYKSAILIDEKFEKIKNKLIPFLSKSDSDILTSSIAILNQENVNPEHARTLYRLMTKPNQFGERGKRIFKRLRDSSFEKVIIQFIEDLEKLKPTGVKDIFYNFFESFLNETADRIWVKIPASMDIISQISDKMKKYNKISVYVAGDKTRIEAVDKACREFISQNKGYSLNVLEGTYLGQYGRIFIISKI